MQNWESRCSDCCIGILVRQINYRLVLQVCTAPKPPLCKGRWAADRRLGGVVAEKCCDFALVPANTYTLLHNPSVKNQRFLTAQLRAKSRPPGGCALHAPAGAAFTQGSLGCSRASTQNLNFSSFMLRPLALP